MQYISSIDTVRKNSLIYYNITMINANYIDNGSNQANYLAKYEEEIPKPFIMNPSEWEFSVVRFTTEGGLFLPILIFQVQPYQSDINLGIYSITLSATFINDSGTKTIIVQQPLEWIPEDQTAIPPSSPVTSQNIYSDYYFVYTYSHFCRIVNNAFQSAMASINTQYHTWCGQNIATKAPYIMFNNGSNTFSVYYHDYGFGGSIRTSAGQGDDENFTLYLDSNLNSLIGNFPSLCVGNDLNQGMVYEMLVSNKLDTNVYEDKSSNSYFVMTQDYPSLSTIWSPISAIAFKSELPVVSEYSSNPIVFDSSNVNSIAMSSNLTERIITDVSLPLQYPHEYRELLNYTPSGEYRIISMIGSQPITKIDMSVWYRLKMTGQLIPFSLPNQTCVTAKFMFRRKEV